MLPLVAVVMTLCGLLAYGVARFGADMVSAARARTAADAAALAAAGDPSSWSSSVDAVARANGAEVVEVEWMGADVRVRVRMLDGRGTEAVARARGGDGGDGIASPDGIVSPDGIASPGPG